MDETEDITHFGSTSLLERISTIRPAYSIFGHVHPGYGIVKNDGTTFVNCAILQDNNELNSPILLDIP